MSPKAPSDFEQHVLLAVWRSSGEAYGLTVRDELERRTGRRVTVGAIYATLVRLEGKGWATSRLAAPTRKRGGKRKRCFEVTPEGIAALAEARRTLDLLWEGLDAPGEAVEG